LLCIISIVNIEKNVWRKKYYNDGKKVMNKIIVPVVIISGIALIIY
jgi:hypothetical protein